MRRAQIHITEEQEGRIIDRGLGFDDGAEERRRAIRATAGVLPDSGGWESWLEQVRGGGADERLGRGFTLLARG